MALGQYNDASDAPNSIALNVSDRIFQIGNGLDNNLRTNALTVLRNGNTGIGVLDPGYRLDLAGRMRIRSGGSGGSSAGIWLNKNDNSGLLGFVGVDGNNDIGIYSNTSGWSFVVDDATGNAMVKGTVTANGVTLTSDERLKKDITPLDEAMPLLEKLNGYQYHWKDASWDASLQTGLLAQEVEKVMPELVKTDDKGLKSVNYIGLIPYMLEAFKGQQKEIEELKKLVAELMKK
ncbi:MAG TPA: tail fiber domain-containing protein [Phnomibacter sp.]|nr:tail fiber domain-containing protein [Phnomibacter sp.]